MMSSSYFAATSTFKPDAGLALVQTELVIISDHISFEIMLGDTSLMLRISP